MDETPVYQVQYTEPPEIKIEAEHLRLAEIVSEKYADRWQDGLLEKIDGLSVFRASHEVAPENARYDVEVRRLLYHGPSGRRSSTLSLCCIFGMERSSLRYNSALEGNTALAHFKAFTGIVSRGTEEVKRFRLIHLFPQIVFRSAPSPRSA